MTTFELNQNDFSYLLGGAAGVVTGLSALNYGFKDSYCGDDICRTDFANSTTSLSIGALLYFGGWVSILRVFGTSREETGTDNLSGMLSIVASILLIVGVCMYLYERLQITVRQMPRVLSAILILSGAFGLATFTSFETGELSSESFDSNKAMWAFAGATLIAISHLGLMPWQRKQGFSDGAGYGTLAFGWTLLAIAHSL